MRSKTAFTSPAVLCPNRAANALRPAITPYGPNARTKRVKQPRKQRTRCATSQNKAEAPKGKNSPEENDDEDDQLKNNSTNQSGSMKKAMSPERRAKISAAMKGRKKSASHRENLRKRFVGRKNPMFGRKVSAETRAKISRSLSERKQRAADGDEDEAESQGEDADSSMEDWKQKALQSRLVESLQQSPSEKKLKKKEARDDVEQTDLEALLDRVANLDAPPENVAKMLMKTRINREATGKQSSRSFKGSVRQYTRMSSGRRNDENDPKVYDNCGTCDGSGMVDCDKCVGAFGVVSSRCDNCCGIGSVYCQACEGVGQIIENNGTSNDTAQL